LPSSAAVEKLFSVDDTKTQQTFRRKL